MTDVSSSSQAFRLVLAEDLRQDFARLGLKSGDAVFVHASLSAMGHVVGGPRTVIEALQAVVGPEGLIAMPGFTDECYPPENRDPPPPEHAWAAIREAIPPYDPALTPLTGMGAIAEAFQVWPDVRRSAHPAVSVCAWGAGAEAFTAAHALNFGAGSGTPFAALAADPNGKVLLLGVGWNRCTLLHTAETQAPHRRLKTRLCRVRDEDGAPVWREYRDVGDDLGRFFPACGAAFEETGAVSRDTVGAAEARLFHAGTLMRFAVPWLDAALKDASEQT